MALTKKQIAAGMDCVIVGGCAAGLVLPKVRMDAQWIELSRPDYIKPLENSLQTTPEVVNESDHYEIHPIQLHNSPGNRAIFAIAVVEGRSLTWAFGQLVKGYSNDLLARLAAANLIVKN